MTTGANFQTRDTTGTLSTNADFISSFLPNSSSTDETQWTWSPMWHWWEILQLFLAMIGIAGNSLVMVVLFRGRRKLCSTDILIAGLALADLLTSIFIIPFPKIRTLPNTIAAQAYCRLIHSSAFMWTSVSASIYTLSTISVERYIAVAYPFIFKRIFTTRRITIIIGVIWIFSFTINTLSIYGNFIKKGKCGSEFPSLSFQKFIGVSYLLVKYLLPVGVMVSAHILTIRSLTRRTETLTARNAQQDLRLLEARRRVIGTFFIVVIMFIICWTPDQLALFALSLGLVPFTYLYSPLYRTFVVLGFVNSCVNPIIYAARNSNFRKALREVCSVVPETGIHNIFDANYESTDKLASSACQLVVFRRYSV